MPADCQLSGFMEVRPRPAACLVCAALQGCRVPRHPDQRLQISGPTAAGFGTEPTRKQHPQLAAASRSCRSDLPLRKMSLLNQSVRMRSVAQLTLRPDAVAHGVASTDVLGSLRSAAQFSSMVK
ncbi:hypothetical protein ACQKWADRAFT_256969 [Trichoderma austrokoningii]